MKLVKHIWIIEAKWKNNEWSLLWHDPENKFFITRENAQWHIDVLKKGSDLKFRPRKVSLE